MWNVISLLMLLVVITALANQPEVKEGYQSLTNCLNQGYPHNFCKYFCENKNIYYEGDWNQGQMNGLGYYEDNNIKYEGEWSNSKFNGMGTLHENNLIYNEVFLIYHIRIWRLIYQHQHNTFFCYLFQPDVHKDALTSQ